MEPFNPEQGRLQRHQSKEGSVPILAVTDFSNMERGWLECAMDYIRQDNITATAVEQAIAAALLSNLQVGAKIMKESGLPIQTALRVLLHPSQRRAGDWHH